MIPFFELTNWYYSTLAIGEPEEKEINSGKNPKYFYLNGIRLAALMENGFHFPGQLMVHCFPVGGNKSAFSLA
jgi:hypothetical protein